MDWVNCAEKLQYVYLSWKYSATQLIWTLVNPNRLIYIHIFLLPQWCYVVTMPLAVLSVCVYFLSPWQINMHGWLIWIHTGHGVYRGHIHIYHTWNNGVLLLFIIMATAFLDYVLSRGHIPFHFMCLYFIDIKI